MVATAALLGGGAIVAVAVTSKSSAPALPVKQSSAGGVQVSAPSSGSTIAEALGGGMQIGSSSFLRKRQAATMGSAFSGVVGTSPNAGWGSEVSPTNGIDVALQQKLAEIERYAKAQYEQANQEAKDAAAKKLSEELGLDPPLTGKESWEDIVKISAGAIGVAVGTAALGWIPGIGPVLGPIVGAYLGVELAELINKNVEEIGDWFEERYAGIKGWVSGVGSDIEEGVKDAIDYIGGWF